MTIGDNPATEDESLDDVFARDDAHDSEADSVASEGQGQPRDEHGRFAAPQPTPETAETPEATPETPSPAPQQPDPSADRHVPLAELLAERKARQESERKALEAEAQMRAYQQMAQSPPASRQQVQQAPQPPPQPPDMFEDPAGYTQWMQEQNYRARRDDLVAWSLASVKKQHSADLIAQAEQAAMQQPGIIENLYHRSADPYGDLIDWYRKQQALQKIGPDPDAYEKSLAEKIRSELLAELKAGKIGVDGQPVTKPTFPGTLAGATATGKQGAHLTPQTAADSVFARPEA